MDFKSFSVSNLNCNSSESESYRFVTDFSQPELETYSNHKENQSISLETLINHHFLSRPSSIELEEENEDIYRNKESSKQELIQIPNVKAPKQIKKKKKPSPKFIVYLDGSENEEICDKENSILGKKRKNNFEDKGIEIIPKRKDHKQIYINTKALNSMVILLNYKSGHGTELKDKDSLKKLPYSLKSNITKKGIKNNLDKTICEIICENSITPKFMRIRKDFNQISIFNILNQSTCPNKKEIECLLNLQYIKEFINEIFLKNKRTYKCEKCGVTINIPKEIELFEDITKNSNFTSEELYKTAYETFCINQPVKKFKGFKTKKVFSD